MKRHADDRRHLYKIISLKYSGDFSFVEMTTPSNNFVDNKSRQPLSYNHHAAGYINKRTEMVLPAGKPDALTGNYKSKQFGNVRVERINNELLLKSGDKTFTLYPQSDTSFFTKERDLVFEFITTNNKPVKIIVKEHGTVADEAILEK